MVDLRELAAAGVANVEGRRPLLEFLDGLGFTTEQIVAAERRGRLFGLAGDAVAESGPALYSLRRAADALDRPVEEIEHVWSALGLTVSGPDEVALSSADFDVLRLWSDMSALVGSDALLGLLRVVGASAARIADAAQAVSRVAIPDLQIGAAPDELTVARTWHAIAHFVPRAGAMIDAVYRHHIVGARRHFEAVAREVSANVVCGVGFADLSGFTELTERLTAEDLSALLNEFTAEVTALIHDQGGRVVKFLGDAVMWVSATPAGLTAVARAIVEHPAPRREHLGVRAGLAFGSMLALDGDYFGGPVNLAARLVAAAQPGQVLASRAVCERLPQGQLRELEPLLLKGFSEPQPVFELAAEEPRVAGLVGE